MHNTYREIKNWAGDHADFCFYSVNAQTHIDLSNALSNELYQHVCRPLDDVQHYLEQERIDSL